MLMEQITKFLMFCCQLEWILLFGGVIFSVIGSFSTIFISVLIHRRISDFQHLLTMEYINFFSMFSWLYFFILYVHLSSRNRLYVKIITIICKIGIGFITLYQIRLVFHLTMSMEYVSWMFISAIIGYTNMRLYKYILDEYRDESDTKKE